MDRRMTALGSAMSMPRSTPESRFFHTQNRGLSCARNLGLDEAKGEWIGFVDSDDWIEPDMYKCLLRRAEETGADIVECGVYKEYPGLVLEKRRINVTFSGKEAIYALIHGKLSSGVVNKLWNANCFEEIRFPEGRVYEEIATTYRLYLKANYVSGVDAIKYHYFSEGGVSQKQIHCPICAIYGMHKEIDMNA